MEDQGWQALQGSVIEKTKKNLASPQVISKKKSLKMDFLYLNRKKTYKKSQFLMDILSQDFLLFHIKKIAL